MITRTLFLAFVVLLLGAAAMVVTKKLLPRIAKSGGKTISVVETVCIGPQKMVHLLKVGDRKLLLASTKENIVLVGDVTEALSGSSKASLGQEQDGSDAL